ncbi:hypothetical protein IFM89_005199 [Coptis chinensis]|uniref:Pentatricopeptide repeat-containing protein n=1 Tax=Coptis chinensis TaxID=261450 RepID=A0A835LYQ5_9MAGN|nr:hypothetical protein IFM89_005199 [Coptis chinensis]
MNTSKENNSGLMGPKNLQGNIFDLLLDDVGCARVGFGKVVTAEVGCNRRALFERFAAQLANKRQVKQPSPLKIFTSEEAKKQKLSILPEDCTIIDMDEYKAANDLPLPMFTKLTEVKIEEVEMEDVSPDPIIDIHSCDSNNPLAVVEYIKDIYSYYRKTECVKGKPLFDFDQTRMFRSCLVGFSLHGSLSHYYCQFCEALFPFQDWWVVPIKVAFDQTARAALWNSIYFVVLGLLCFESLASISSELIFANAYYDAGKLFGEVRQKDTVSWNSMISGYAQHGFGRKALRLFGEMNRRRVKLDWITFVAVLSACNHAGPDHYACIVDLLGRASLLNKAVEMIKRMPFKPHCAIFGTLLGVGKTHKNSEAAEYATQNLLDLDPTSAAGHV